MGFTVDQLCSDAGTESRVDCGNRGPEIMPRRVFRKAWEHTFAVKCDDHGRGAGVGFICRLSLPSVLFQIHFLRTLFIDLLEHHLEERGGKNLLTASCVFLVIFL